MIPIKDNYKFGFDPTIEETIYIYIYNFFKWTREELRQMDLMIMHKALHPRDDIDYTYQKKKEEEVSAALNIASVNQHEDSKTT